MLSLNSRVFKKKDMPWRIIEGEALLVDVDKGDVLYLNEVGASIWRTINEKVDKKTLVKDIVGYICSQFEVDKNTAEADVLQFLNKLAEGEVLGY